MQDLVAPDTQQINNLQIETRKRYPDYTLVFKVRQSDVGLEYSLYFQPGHSKPLPKLTPLFRLSEFWLPLELFYWEDGSNELQFLFHLFPDQHSLQAGYELGLGYFKLSIFEKFLNWLPDPNNAEIIGIIASIVTYLASRAFLRLFLETHWDVPLVAMLLPVFLVVQLCSGLSIAMSPNYVPQKWRAILIGACFQSLWFAFFTVGEVETVQQRFLICVAGILISCLNWAIAFPISHWTLNKIRR
jgi:hypothetical protein